MTIAEQHHNPVIGGRLCANNLIEDAQIAAVPSWMLFEIGLRCRNKWWNLTYAQLQQAPLLQFFSQLRGVGKTDAFNTKSLCRFYIAQIVVNENRFFSFNVEPIQ